MSKIKCYNCGEFGHFARDCPKARDNAYIAQESEQQGKSESMLDLDNICVCEECVMVCTELQYQDASKDEVVYGDQGIDTEEYEKATYEDLMKTQSEEENEVKCQGSALESLDSIPHASDIGVTKGDRRVQKHDDRRNGSDPVKI